LLRSSSGVAAEVDLLAGLGVSGSWAVVLVPAGLGRWSWLGWLWACLGLAPKHNTQLVLYNTIT